MKKYILKFEKHGWIIMFEYSEGTSCVAAAVLNTIEYLLLVMTKGKKDVSE